MSRTYRPVLDDQDLSIIVASLNDTVENFLDAATSEPDMASDALAFREQANELVGRFERLMARPDSPIEEEVPGQTHLDDLVTVPDPLTDDFSE
jgi:hypothetical protein